jgi:hypothetical protein
MSLTKPCTHHVNTCSLKQIVVELCRSVDYRRAHNDAVWHDILTELAAA